MNEGCQAAGMRATVSVNALAAACQHTITDTKRASPRDMTFSFHCKGQALCFGDGEKLFLRTASH